MGHYQQIDHTADIALYVNGEDLEDLFKTASDGWRHLVVGKSDVTPEDEKVMKLSAETLEELLVECLSELNYLFMSKQWLFRRYDKLQIYDESPNFELIGVLRGESLKNNQCQIETEIKAVTFHQLQVRKTEKGYETMIVFDI
jgi:SHS2 domain-containing protein